MIEVKVLTANEDFKIDNKNGTFLKGHKYFLRESADGNAYVARSEEGYWVVIEHHKSWTYNRIKIHKMFTCNAVIYMKNRKRLNYFASVEEYFRGDNIRPHRGYSFIFEDKFLYDSQ